MSCVNHNQRLAVRTGVKAGAIFANHNKRLRERLQSEGQSLVILRINRRLSWDEIARNMCEEEGESSAQELRKKAAALRKQFQRAKERLPRLVKQERVMES